MGDGILNSTDRRSLKQAFHIAVKAAGGQTACEPYTRVDQTTLSRAGNFANPAHADAFPAADTVVEVDLLAGTPVTLRAMARLLGHALIPLPEVAATGPAAREAAAPALRRLAQAAGPQRPEIVLDTENFPTDRYVAEGIAAETGAELVWLEPDPAKGVTPDLLAPVLTDRTGVVLLSHVAYKSAWIADLPEITRLAHEAGALVLWDLCHSVGVVASDLDAHGVDLAVGCTYKFLGGGPGAPAFGYVAARHQARLRQPIQGWMGHADPFVMGPGYEPGAGMRGFISGTPPVLGMVGIEDTVDLIESVGLNAVRDKAAGLGRFVIAAVDERLARLGVRLVSPREDATRGGHVTITHEDFREVYRALWDEDVVPDFREPDGIRLGLSPLSTSFDEVAEALLRIEELLA